MNDVPTAVATTHRPGGHRGRGDRLMNDVPTAVFTTAVRTVIEDEATGP